MISLWFGVAVFLTCGGFAISRFVLFNTNDFIRVIIPKNKFKGMGDFTQ
jgi:hypothetical protein